MYRADAYYQIQTSSYTLRNLVDSVDLVLCRHSRLIENVCRQESEIRREGILNRHGIRDGFYGLYQVQIKLTALMLLLMSAGVWLQCPEMCA